MLIIGSVALQRALSKRGFGFSRIPGDLDVICSETEMRDYARQNGLYLRQLADYKWRGKPKDNKNRVANQTVEFELLSHSKSGHEYLAASVNYMSVREYIEAWNAFGSSPKPEIFYGPLEVLYSIKMAHRHYPRAWKKHAQDRSLMQKLLGGVDCLDHITKIREKETEEREGKLKTPSLNKAADDFFKDNVSNKTFIHDDIHAVMAHREKPMFEYIKKNETKVACSREKFDALPFEDRVRCVLEEAYVIALERHIIPMLFAGGPPKAALDAFDWALMRISTNLCSGWFREFAVMNYDAIMNTHNPNYPLVFLLAVQHGRIHKISKEAHVESQRA